MSGRTMTAGEALRLHLLPERSAASPWADLDPVLQQRWIDEAAVTLSDAAAIRERMGAAVRWMPIETRPEFDQQPIRQFIVVEGWKQHSGSTWHRVHADLAYILREDNADSMFGYRRSDMVRIMTDGDMDGIDRVTHWMPGALPRIPQPEPPK